MTGSPSMTPSEEYVTLLLLKDELEFIMKRMERIKERAALSDDEGFKSRLKRYVDGQAAECAEEMKKIDRQLAEAKAGLA